ncbi:MAG: dTDP-4-dehydrorhamnose reductase [Bacteroidia bacterium]|jgi:dTDP-4-dehydrorhamnose reductase
MTQIKVLVTGGNGQLGQALKKSSEAYPEIDFSFYGSAEADVTDIDSLKTQFDAVKPEFCINAAAYTAVDKAESEPEKAGLINVQGAANLAEVCNSFGTTLLHVSTDFVFDGTGTQPYVETDTTNPVSVYGTTKLGGEEAIIAVADKYFIIRTSWVYSEFANNFYKTMLRVGIPGATVKVVSDQVGSPTNANDLAGALISIIKSGSTAYGIYHYSGEGQCSWYDFAKEIFAVNKINVDLHAIPTASYPTPAQRPAYSVMDKSKIKNEFGIATPHWKERLKSVIAHEN